MEGTLMLLKNKIAIVTGAGKGIGKETALDFAREGADLVLISRTLNDLEKISKQVQKYNVKTYISGHDHNLQIHTIKNNCTNYQLKHLVSGAGSSIYEHRSFPIDKDNDNIFFRNGFIKLVISGKSNQLKVVFVDEHGIELHSEII